MTDTRTATQPWRCTRCHTRLAWTATTVGCPSCRITTTLPQPTEAEVMQR